MKRTLQRNKRRYSKTHGFRARMATKDGQNIIQNRRRKGRAVLAH